MALRAENLTVARGGVAVLEGVSFEVPDGGALVLRGPNGSGKTTLLRTLLGLLSAPEGRVTPGSDAMAHLGHRNGIKPTLTVAENLAFWARIFGSGRIDGAMEALALNPLQGRAAGTLSAGQSRRLGLARLLVAARPVWLLDEPTTALDRASTAAFEALLANHLKAGGTAVIASHAPIGLDRSAFEIRDFDVASHAAKARPDTFQAAFE